MQVERTKLEEVLLIKPEPFQGGAGEYFEDARGVYVETYNKKKYREHGIDVEFVEDDYSSSKRGVLRGIHGDEVTWKLISCHLGEFFLAVVDCREESKDFGKWQGFNLTDKNRWQVLVPPRFGNGHLALTDRIIFNYKQSSYYNPEGQFSYRWDDIRFNIDWPVENPILSKRDELADTSQVLNN